MKPQTAAITLAPALTPARTESVTVIDLIDRLVGPGGKMTQEGASALATLVKLKNDEEDRNAQREFTRAFRDLQDELPVIVAQTAVPNRGKYERYEDLMKVVGPLLRKHGFGVRFSQNHEPGRVTTVGTLSHIGGRSETTTFTVRTGKADDDTQADKKAATTSKRYCFSNMLNLVIRQDEDDASLEGHPINPQQAEELKRLVKVTGTIEPYFFKFAGGKEPVKDYSDIMSNRYDELHEYLSKRERVQKQKAQ